MKLTKIQITSTQIRRAFAQGVSDHQHMCSKQNKDKNEKQKQEHKQNTNTSNTNTNTKTKQNETKTKTNTKTKVFNMSFDIFFSSPISFSCTDFEPSPLFLHKFRSVLQLLLESLFLVRKTRTRGVVSRSLRAGS